MKFDTIIIGGGLSGLFAGIALASSGRRTAILAKGQSKLHFGSGSLDLLGYDPQGNTVDDPVAAIAALPVEHPYRKLHDVEALVKQARGILADAGVETTGDDHHNHYRITPTGMLKPTWLTLSGYATSDSPDELPWRHVALMNIKGFLDFPVDFVAAGLRRRGVTVDVKEVTIPQIERRRANPSEMRSPNIARVLADSAALVSLAGKINSHAGDAQAVLLPAVVSLEDNNAIDHLHKLVGKPLHLVATLPPSVGGTRLQTLLRKHFVRLGGTYLLGSSVKTGTIGKHRVTGITARNLPDQVIKAQNFVLAAGSFMSGGLTSNYERIVEPIFGLDINASDDRNDWSVSDIFGDQPYMHYGVLTDDRLHALKDGAPVDNLWATGSILGGHNPLLNADDAGTSILTALQVARNIEGR